MERPQRKAGRPVGTVKYPHVKMFRLSDLDAQRLEALTKLWNCTEAAVIRRLLARAANGEESQ